MGNNRRDVSSGSLRLCRDSGIIDVQCTSLTRLERKTRHVRDKRSSWTRKRRRENEAGRDSCGDRRHKSFRSDSYTYLLIICSCGGGFLDILSRTRNSSNIISGGLLSSLWDVRFAVRRREKCQPFPCSLPHSSSLEQGLASSGSSSSEALLFASY